MTRLFVKRAHLLLALLGSVPLLLVSFTGSLLVYQDALDFALNRDLMEVEIIGQRRTYDEIFQNLQKKYPEVRFTAMHRYREANRAYEFWDDGDENWTTYYVNPYTVEVLGQRRWNDWSVRNIIWIILDLHYSLKAGEPGRYVVGLSAILCLFSILTGFFLWLPRSLKTLRYKLGLKIGKRWKQTAYTWHGNLGFYFSVVLLIITVTGFSMTFYDFTVKVLHWMTFSPPPVEVPRLAMKADQEPISIEELFHTAQEYIWQKYQTRPWPMQFNFASADNAVVRTRFQEKYSLYNAHRYNIWMDPYTGQILAEESPPQFNKGQALVGWIGPLHFGTWGDAFHPGLGSITRIAWVLGALMPIFLLLTGVLIWRKPNWWKRGVQAIKKRSLKGSLRKRDPGSC